MHLNIPVIFIIFLNVCLIAGKINSKNVVVEGIGDMKELKKLFRTKNNVLVLFISSAKETQNAVNVFREVAEVIKGQGTMVLLDCSNSEVKKICKKLKASPSPYILKHFKDGDYHKDYDRQMTAISMANFMRDPAGDLPWEEDPSGVDVLHISDSIALAKFLKKESKPILMLFYTPWCGFCKSLKPEFSAAATELKPKHVLAAIDVNRPENSIIRKQYNITGFPTLLYYEGGKFKKTYEGENNKAGLISFMQNPNAPPPVKPKEPDWASEDSEVVHLTSTSFEPALKDEKSALVMFYAPWCGHCKKMKPEYEKAAETMKNKNIPGVLAALDATKEGSIAGQFNVRGYPTVKYFSNGEFKFDVNVRDAEKIIEFMKNPSEPPPPPPAEKAWEEEPSEVVHLNDETFKPFLKKKKHVIVMFYAPWCGHCKRTKPEFVKAAERFKDDPRVELAAVDCTKHNAICSAYEVRGYPTIKYYSYLKTVKEYDGGRTEADLVKYLSDPNSSETPKSQAEPFGDFPGVERVAVLNDGNIKDVIKKESRLMIMFYAPWCGHCMKMKPDWAEFAQMVFDKQAVGKVAAIDCDQNKKACDEFEIHGFPTIKYYEKGKFIKDYDGKRRADQLFVFMESRGNSPKTEL